MIPPRGGSRPAMDSALYERVREAFEELCELEPSVRARRLDALELSDDVRAEVLSLLEFEEAGASLPDEELGGVGLELLEERTRDLEGEDLPTTVGAYRIHRRLGSGGMGIVYEAHHPDSYDACALKVLRPELARGDVARRFRREARILKDLRHPGIAAFHDAGEAEARHATGSVRVSYLALERVEGLPLSSHADEAGLDLLGRLELVARVCDALQHAHDRGVVHRDLKPTNVLVRRRGDGEAIGAPVLLDFGIAAVAEGLEGDRSLSATRTGAWFGTLAYMSPEQVRDGSARAGARSDLYSLAVVAFELVTGAMPYELRGIPIAEAARRIQEDEPDWTGLDARAARGDLRVVLGKALEKSPARRYASAAALASDLRAVARGQSIDARPPGALRRLARAARRRPLLSASSVLLAGTLVAVSLLWRQTVLGQRRAEANRRAAEASLALAQSRTATLERERNQVLRLASLASLDALEAEEGSLWPARPERVAAFDAWLAEADRLLAERESSAAFLAGLEEADAAARLGVEAFELDWWRSTLTELVRRLDELDRPGSGARARVAAGRAEAATLTERTVDAHREAWERTLAGVRSSPRYAGLAIVQQPGLVPLGADPASGLYEFWQPATGERPPRDPSTGSVAMTEEGGLVFVLLPGGPFDMGATTEPGAVNEDEWAKERDGPVHRVTLSPFFVSKFELTQGQWLRLTGENPSERPPGTVSHGVTHDLRFPVGNVGWEEARRTLLHVGLDLPTEAQWEFAARADTSTPRPLVGPPDLLARFENVADARALELFPEGRWFQYEPWRDGHVYEAAVGSYAANPFGLHDVLGNLHEWCRDVFDGAFYSRSPERDPLRTLTPDDPTDHQRVVRGGSFKKDSRWARSAFRVGLPPSIAAPEVGLRPVRRLDG